jgi:hypothetical protein
LKATIAKNVTTRGKIARLRDSDRCLFHSLDADNISEALRRRIKQRTDATLTSATPIVVKALMALIADVVLNADVVIADVVLSMDDSICFSS